MFETYSASVVINVVAASNIYYTITNRNLLSGKQNYDMIHARN